MDKQYVVITDAIRENLDFDFSGKERDNPDPIINQFQYRQGDIGLIHPIIVDYYNRLIKGEINPPYFNSAIDGGGFSNWLGANFYNWQKEDVPVLIRPIDSLSGRVKKEVNLDYLVIPLHNHEFMPLHKKTIKEMQREIRKNNLSNFSNKTLEEVFGYLESFDNLVGKRFMTGGKYDILIEGTYRKIPREHIESELSHLKHMEELRKKDFRGPSRMHPRLPRRIR